MDEATVEAILALPSVQALPPRRREFVLAYIRTQNASAAARAAGYRDNPRHSQQIARAGGRLLADCAVSAAVREGLAIRWRALLIGPDELLARASRIARHDHRRLLQAAAADPTLSTLDDDTAEALAGVKVRREVDKHGAVKAETVEYRTASKLQAIELMARVHRLIGADPTAGDVGAAFADAMARAAHRAALRDAAAGADDARVIEHADAPALQSSSDRVSSAAADQFAEGAQ